MNSGLLGCGDGSVSLEVESRGYRVFGIGIVNRIAAAELFSLSNWLTENTVLHTGQNSYIE